MTNDLVTPEQLADYMSDLGLDEVEEAAAHVILDGLVESLELFLNRPIVRRERTELLVPDAAGRVWPSATPIASVTVPTGVSVAVAGNYAVVGWSSSPVSLTYVGGLDDRHTRALRLAVLRVAAREMTERHDDTLSVKRLDPDDAPAADPRELGFTDDELAKFNRLRRRTVV